MLSPQGMRQHFLLGRFNFKWFSSHEFFNGITHHNITMFHSELDATSTNVFRTIQSVNSYLMGQQYEAMLNSVDQSLFPLRLTSWQHNRLMFQNKGAPPFSVRRLKIIDAELGA